MKMFMKSLSVFAFGLMATLGPTSTAYADDARASDDIGQVVDATKQAGSVVKDCAEDLQKFLSTTKDEKALEMVVNSLKKAGLDDGWAKQISGLKKFAGIAGKLLDAITIGDTVRKLSGVWDDREAFSSVFADQMTEYAAQAVSGFVSAAIKTYGTAVIAGSTVVAPGIGTIVATGAVWIVGWGVGEVAGWAVKKAVGADVIRGGMEDLGGAIWDWFHNGGGDEDDDGNGQMCKPGDPDPFDSQPESGHGDSSGKKERFQGLKPLKLLD